ncbi:MAG: hypothetical protein LCH89_00310 [Proteobacteria bacterium]|nr:hypothetical protein [Pseudomonadota bacterium]
MNHLSIFIALVVAAVIILTVWVAVVAVKTFIAQHRAGQEPTVKGAFKSALADVAFTIATPFRKLWAKVRAGWASVSAKVAAIMLALTIAIQK